MALPPSRRGRGHWRLAGRDRRRRPATDAPDNYLADLSDPHWSGGVAVPQRLMSPITVDDRSSRPTRRSSASCGPTYLGYPLSSRGHSFLELDAVGLPGVPVLDQLIEVLLGIYFEH